MIDSDDAVIKQYLKKKHDEEREKDGDSPNAKGDTNDEAGDGSDDGAARKKKMIDHFLTKSQSESAFLVMENGDQLTPLPGHHRQDRRDRLRRSKSRSLPSTVTTTHNHHAMFFELNNTTATVDVSMIPDVSDSYMNDDDDDALLIEQDDLPELPQSMRERLGGGHGRRSSRRQSRSKALSYHCPTHMLMQEAEKKVNASYFFG